MKALCTHSRSGKSQRWPPKQILTIICCRLCKCMYVLPMNGSSGNLLIMSLTTSPPCLMMVMASEWSMFSVLLPLISSSSSPTYISRGYKELIKKSWTFMSKRYCNRYSNVCSWIFMISYFLWNYKCHDWWSSWWSLKYIIISIILYDKYQSSSGSSAKTKLNFQIYFYLCTLLLTIPEGGSKRFFFLSNPRN